MGGISARLQCGSGFMYLLKLKPDFRRQVLWGWGEDCGLCGVISCFSIP